MAQEAIAAGAELASEPAPSQGDRRVMWFMGTALLVFSVGLVWIGVASLYQPAADPQGVNAVREDLKGFVLFVLGAFAGVMSPKGMR